MMSRGQKPTERKIKLEEPKGHLKAIGGAEYDAWNSWLMSSTSSALPDVNLNDEHSATVASVAVVSGMIDMKPADPVEGIIIAQLMTANQASLSMYQRAWAQENFEARLKYLALADKAARTVMMLTERLDQHRGRGQQQITVKHVTVNADQAVVTDQLVTGKPEGVSPALLTAITEKPMLMITDETIKPEGVGKKIK
jgi:hypothetical protein